MTVKTDNKQDIDIALLKEKVEQLDERLKDNFGQHAKDFYPLKVKFYWLIGIFSGLNIAVMIYNFLSKMK